VTIAWTLGMGCGLTGHLYGKSGNSDSGVLDGELAAAYAARAEPETKRFAIRGLPRGAK
jgi:hypothetical protein